MKKCKSCLTTKPEDEFYYHNTTKDRLNQKCKDCCRAIRSKNIRRNEAKKVTNPVDLTQDMVNNIFYYKDGFLYYKSNNKLGTWGIKSQYKTVTIKDHTYKQARIIFLMHHGFLPQIVDHINRIKTDDRIENLRAATYSENNANRTKSKNTLFKYHGVLNKNRNTYIAALQKDKKTYRSLSFKTVEEAALAYNKLAVKHHGEFANLNIIQP